MKKILIHRKNFETFWAHYDVFTDKNFIDELRLRNIELYRSIDRPNIIPDRIIYIESDSYYINLKDIITELLKLVRLDPKPLLTRMYMFRFTKKKWRKNRTLIAFEGIIHQPKNHSEKNQKDFGKILTWNIDLVKRFPQSYSKFNWPQPLELNYKKENFENKKLIINISANKNSTHPLELYSERLLVIKLLNSYYPNDFDLFGFDWQNFAEANLNKEVYKGSLDLDKLEVLYKYKFAIVYENAKVNGWVTEKLFDCLRGGCIPIYVGAPDIDTYVPHELFIDPRKYANMEEMFSYMAKMGEKEHEQWLNRIRLYLQSDDFTYRHSCIAFARTIAETF